MAYLNRCEFIGHVGADPEVRSTPSGSQVANFRIAVTKRWKVNGEPKESTVWVNFVAWKERAKFVQSYVRKGAHIMVVGELSVRSWEDKNGKGKQYATEILVSEVHLLDRKEGGGANPRPAATDDFSDYGQSSGQPEDDLPF